MHARPDEPWRQCVRRLQDRWPNLDGTPWDRQLLEDFLDEFRKHALDVAEGVTASILTGTKPPGSAVELGQRLRRQRMNDAVVYRECATCGDSGWLNQNDDEDFGRGSYVRCSECHGWTGSRLVNMSDEHRASVLAEWPRTPQGAHR